MQKDDNRQEIPKEFVTPQQIIISETEILKLIKRIESNEKPTIHLKTLMQHKIDSR